MKISSRIVRRVGVAAVALGAIAVPAAALAAPGTAAKPAAPAAVHRCYRSQLMTWMGIPGSGTAGSIYYPLEFSNISHQTCTLFGYPGVQAIGSDGTLLGSPAGRVPSGPIQLVTLAPGQTAHALLQIAIAGVYPAPLCKPATAIALKVYAANDFQPGYIQFSFPACAKPGPVYMHVHSTVSGVGIPLYSTS